MFYTHVPTPVGQLLLAGSEKALQIVRFQRGSKVSHPTWKPALTDYFDAQHRPADLSSWAAVESAGDAGAVVVKAAIQIGEYFDGERRTFDLSLAPFATVRKTDFREQVWEAVERIPYGETWTALARHPYGDVPQPTYQGVANAIDRPKSAMAVGQALADNPLLVVIPCHRVIGTGGNLRGYAGGPYRQRYLLEMESRHRSEG